MKNDSRDVVVLGAGGHAKVVIATVQASGGHVLALYDDDPAKKGTRILGVGVEGPVRDAQMRTDAAAAIIALGSNRARAELARSLPLRWGRAIHPSAIVHESALIGEGAVIFAGAIVQPDTRIGAHAILNTGCSVDHDCVIGDFAHIAPGARLAGGVHVGAGALLGIGSAYLPGSRVGAWATVGAGAVVLRQVEDGAQAVGVPARDGGRHL